MLAGSIIFITAIKGYGERITDDLGKAIELYQDDSPDKALRYINDAEKHWNEYYHILCYVMPSDFIQETTKDVLNLKVLLTTGSDDFVPQCQGISYSIRIIYENEFPFLRTLI